MASERPELSARRRGLLYAAAWAGAFLGCAVVIPLWRGETPTPDSVLTLALFAWLFPVGLSGWFVEGAPDRYENMAWLVPLWLGYLAHGYVTLRSRREARFYALMAVLAVVLTINVAGCQRHPIRLRIG